VLQQKSLETRLTSFRKQRGLGVGRQIVSFAGVVRVEKRSVTTITMAAKETRGQSASAL